MSHLDSFSAGEVEFGRYLWFHRDFPSLGGLCQSQDVLRWERLKPEVQVEFCTYARMIRGRELRGVRVKEGGA